MTLTARERRSLHAVCDALLPRLDDPVEARPHFRLGAADLGVPEAVDQAIASLTPRLAAQLRLFLVLLDSPAFMLVAAGQLRAFAALDARARERALLRMAHHPLPPIRTGFQALKRLSVFLFYSAVPGDGAPNPVLADLGYTIPPPVAPGRIVSIAAPPPDRSGVVSADVCVIGSGAGGSVVAAALARAGRRVLILEAGPADQAPDFDHHELVGTQRLYLDQGTTATRDLGIAILAGRSVGGGTTVNWQTSLRTPDFIRDEWAERSRIRDFADTRFSRALDAVCERLGVGTAESVVNPNNTPLQRGCEALGYDWTLIPRNARGCDLTQCGFCVFGCRHGGKQSTTVTYLADAIATGNAAIMASCRAQALRIERGRVRGVHAVVTDERTGAQRVLRVDAPLVVVAAGAIETPALLLRSGVEHAELGRNLYLHPTSAVGALHPEPIRGWLGAPQTVLCNEFARLRGNHGIRIETPPIHPGVYALATPWAGGRDYREHMQHFAHTSAFVILTRDEHGGRVRLDRDSNAVIDYAPHRAQRELLRRGIAEAARIQWAAGATEVHTVHATPLRLRRSDPGADIESFAGRIMRAPVHGNRSQLFSAHQMGTCRMGTDVGWSVCDPHGAVRGVRGLYVADTSLFPAASGVNPMISVMALAHLVGEGLTSGA